MRNLIQILLLSLLPLSAAAQDQVGTLAGQAGDVGSVDGSGSSARFNDPSGIAVGPDGRVYLADSRNHVIRVMDTNGMVTTLAGLAGEPGTADGPGESARFDHPSGITVRPDGTVLVGDTGNHAIRQIATNGTVSTLAGLNGTGDWIDGPAAAARFRSPIGLAVGSDGDVYVADCGNHVIRRIDAGGSVTTFAGKGEEWGAMNGTGTNATFNSPLDLAFAANGDLYVSDANNYAIRRITPTGVVTLFAGQPGEDGVGDGIRARFGKPAEVAVDSLGRLFVADSLNHTIRQIRSDGFVSTIAGSVGTAGSADGVNGAARFFNPYGLAVRPNGRLLISDAYNQTVRDLVAPFTVALAPGTGQLVVSWEATIGSRYQVEQADAVGGTWSPVGAVMEARQLLMNATNEIGASAAAFFRVVRSP